MQKLTEGMAAPLFTAKNQNGKEISLEQFKGKKVILYFYPKDNTPGCTAESCNLNENLSHINKKGFEIIGVSPDSETSHLGFATRYSLEFNLLSDKEKKILNAYGAYGEKISYGKTSMGVLRTTFIINEEGIIDGIIRKVDTKNHTEQIFEYLNNR